MGAAASITDATRSALWIVLESEERRIGSRDQAYNRVGDMIGVSGSWIKKFLLKSHEAKEPRISVFMRIREVYDTVCNRVEQEQAIELLKISKLRGELHAVTDGFDRLVQGETRT